MEVSQEASVDIKKYRAGIAEEEEREFNLKSLFKAFAETTTAHGFSHIAQTGNLVIRAIWVFAMIGCFVLLTLQFQPLVVRYLEKPTATKITIVREKHPVFPVVVICNENMIRSSMLGDLMRDESISFSLKWAKEGVTADFSLEAEKVTTPKSKVPLHTYGHIFNDTVQKCKWKNTIDCGTKYWKVLWHYAYGACFAFNSGFDDNGEDAPVFNVSRNGPASALEIKLNVNKFEYDPITRSLGMKVFIGVQGALISPRTEGLGVSPGFAYAIGLEKTIIQRNDPFQNGSCVKDKLVKLSPDSVGQKVITKYTQEFCYQDCLAKNMYKKCGCVEYWLPRHRSQGNITTCTNDEKYEDCVIETIRVWAAGEMECLEKCNPPCREVKYNYQVGMQRLYSFNKTSQEEIRENILTLSIFLKHSDYVYYENYEYYLVENLLGDIGGLLGLFNGYSVLTIVEIVFFFGHLFGFLFYICRFKVMIEDKVRI